MHRPGGHLGAWCRNGPPQCPQHRPGGADCVRVGWRQYVHTRRLGPVPGAAVWYVCCDPCGNVRWERRDSRGAGRSEEEAPLAAAPGGQLVDFLRKTICVISTPRSARSSGSGRDLRFSQRGGRVSIDSACVVCLEGFSAGESLIVLPGCVHRFHTGCIAEWLEGQVYCRAHLSSD